jgi:hypothetical protein
LPEPSRSQYHGTVFLAIVVVLGVFALIALLLT